MTAAPSLFPEILPEAGPDVAYTPDRVAAALVEVLAAELRGCVIWEPYVGGDAFGRALTPLASAMLVTDCDAAAPGLRTTDARVPRYAARHDVGRGLPAGWGRPDWIVTNPPFSLLDEHLPILLRTARVGVALLLVGQCLAPAKRDWIWDTAHPDWKLDIRERIPFEGPGRNGKDTDMREYAWIVWRRQPDGSWMGRGLMGRVSTDTGRMWMPGGAS